MGVHVPLGPMGLAQSGAGGGSGLQVEGGVEQEVGCSLIPKRLVCFLLCVWPLIGYRGQNRGGCF